MFDEQTIMQMDAAIPRHVRLNPLKYIKGVFYVRADFADKYLTYIENKYGKGRMAVSCFSPMFKGFRLEIREQKKDFEFSFEEKNGIKTTVR